MYMNPENNASNAQTETVLFHTTSFALEKQADAFILTNRKLQNAADSTNEK